LAAWIRQAWVLMSPLARVHPQARPVGPVVVGPGCIVEAGAQVGPEVVLSSDVVVSGRTQIDRSVVRPNTCIGADLGFSGTVVNGVRIRHARMHMSACCAHRHGR
jgi:NDP-sugar pyrophosphorylase family protein